MNGNKNKGYMCFWEMGKWEKGTRVFVLAGIRRIFVAIFTF